MTPFPALLEQLTPDGDNWRVDPPDDWRQGRTLFGGLSAALCLAACERSAPNLPSLRSAQIAYIGPSAGAVTLQPTILRRGKSVTFMSSDLFADGALATRALLAFGGAREAEARLDGAMPDVAGPTHCRALWNDTRPSFTTHFDQRLAGGTPPMGGGERGELLVWARHEDASGGSPIAALLAVADALPPAAMSRIAKPTIISTMSWHIDLIAPEAFDPAAYVLIRSAENAAAAGYSSQDMQMWNESGNLIALGRQNVAVFA